jgi:glyoxylase-like metal-dependent hydrolase (beta-lactamase superfamily II)/rhodanese-related sulfurtransferase
MYFQQFYLGCLAHASYLIGSDGVAAVVDPQRDVQQYIDAAEARGLEIRYVLETHLHADFVSGHRELAARTGAQIVFGAKAEAEFPHLAVKEGDEIRVGRVVLRTLETPGHTPESVCWLVVDEEVGPDPIKILTGDTLFVGDVGRPDLAGARGYTPQMMAALMFDTIHGKLLTLPDNVEVWPAHGAGSACGRNISSDRSSTIGDQRRMNYALRPMSREQFVEMMTSEIAEPPRYFPMDAAINRMGARPLTEIVASPLAPREFNKKLQQGAISLDVRDCAAWAAGHVPHSLNIGLGGEFASWAGSLLPHDIPVILVTDSEAEAAEAVMRLARVGLENCAGYLDGGIKAWEDAGLAVETVPQVDVVELEQLLAKSSDMQIVDVRRPGEFASARVPGARLLPLNELERSISRIDGTRPTAVICAGGYRSSIACSVMRRHGLTNEMHNVIGGTSAWVAAGFSVERG